MEVESWKDKEPTEKQMSAIINMRSALGCTDHESPKTRGDASKEIASLKEVIINNLSLGGSINARHSVYERNYEGLEESCWSDFGNN